MVVRTQGSADRGSRVPVTRAPVKVRPVAAEQATMLPISIDPGSAAPIHQQVFDRLRTAISEGLLVPGTRIPATREVARQYGIGRTTVVMAYERLVAEGFLVSHVGAWTCVAARPPRAAMSRPVAAVGARPSRPDAAPRSPTDRSASPDELIVTPAVYNFHRLYTPAVDQFPASAWRQHVARRWRELTPASLMDLQMGGDPDLRAAIAAHVRSTRGIRCGVDQVIITSGSQQAVEVLARTTVAPGGVVAIEDPSEPHTQNVFHAVGTRLLPVPIDSAGLCVAALRDLDAKPVLLHTTPRHQFPTGVALSVARRAELLAWADGNSVLIVADDYAGELACGGPAGETLCALDTTGVVVYLGTFTTLLNPSVRLGYMIVPQVLAESVTTTHMRVAKQTEIINQAALAKFVRSGQFARHVRRLRRVHMARRDVFVAAMREAFGDRVEIGPVGATLYAHVRWPGVDLTHELLDRVYAAGVTLFPVRLAYMSPVREDPGALMGYAHMTEQEIESGVRVLARALDLR